MDPFSPKRSPANPRFLVLLLSASIFFFIFSFSSLFPSQTNNRLALSNSTYSHEFKDELGNALEKAASNNKTLIITIVNKAYVEKDKNAGIDMLDLFLESFWSGGEETRPLVDRLMVVAMDRTAYNRCHFRRLHCYKLETEGVDFAGEKLYMSEEFIKMMWRRTAFLLDVLKRGYSFIFTDTDVVWLRNPFKSLSSNKTVDLQISTDEFNGDPTSEKNFINTGFYYVRSNNKTIALFNKWYEMKDNSTGQKEQDVLLGLLRRGTFRQLGLNVRFLNTSYFSGFCHDSQHMEAVTTVHANCCRSISAKVKDLSAVLRDWDRYNSLKKDKKFVAANATNFKWTGHWGCWNSWRRSNKTAA